MDNWTLAWALDKTGTIGTLQILSVEETSKKNALIEQQETNRVRELSLSEEVLWVHGVALTSKGVKNNPSHLQEHERDLQLTEQQF